MSPTGDPIQYVSSGGFIEPPTATDVLYRKAHAPQAPKPTGLDWDAITPTCPSCATKSGQIDGTGLCPGCRGDEAVNVIHADVTRYGDSYQVLGADDVAARFTAPDDTHLGQDLAQLEATDPEVAAAAAAFDDMVDRITEPEDYVQAAPRPAVRAKVRAVSPHDVVITVCSPIDPINPVAVAALLSDLLGALTTQSPAATPSPVPAGPTSEGRRPVGKQARPSDTPTAVIRAWAHANGVLDLDHRSGRLPAAVRDAYDHAHPTTSTTN